MSQLKTIEQHNEEVLRSYRDQNRTGVACPKCGKELFYTDKNTMLLSNPPKYMVRCYDCLFVGEIY